MPEKPSKSDVATARSVADQIVRRATADAAFREQLQRDPAGVMRQAGLPAVAVAELSRELVIDGRSLAGGGDGTCHITCIVTSNGRLPGAERANPGQ